MDDWKRTEQVRGIFPITIPKELPLGDYRLIKLFWMWKPAWFCLPLQCVQPHLHCYWMESLI